MIKLLIKGKPISINSAYFRRKGRKPVLNDKARAYRQSCWTSLKLKEAEIKEFVKNFDSTKSALSISIISYVPLKDYYLKANIENGLSQSKGDVDNGLKLLVDFLLNSRYVERNAPVLGIDDKYLIDIELKQRPIKGTEYLTLIEIDKVSLPNIMLTSDQLFSVLLKA